MKLDLFVQADDAVRSMEDERTRMVVDNAAPRGWGGAAEA